MLYLHYCKMLAIGTFPLRHFAHSGTYFTVIIKLDVVIYYFFTTKVCRNQLNKGLEKLTQWDKKGGKN